MQVFLFLETLEEEIAMSCVDVPIEIAEVVPGRVFTVVREFDAGTKLLRAPLGEQPTANYALGHDRQILNARQEVGGKEHGTGPCGALRIRPRVQQRSSRVRECGDYAAARVSSGSSLTMCSMTASVLTPSA